LVSDDCLERVRTEGASYLLGAHPIRKPAEGDRETTPAAQSRRKRNRIERLVNQLKRHRRIATRYEKRAAHYLAMLTLASLLLWL
jgi:transposase